LVLKIEIKYKPSYSMLVATLSKGESIKAEAGSMTYMDPSISVQTTKREQGFFESLGLAIFGGQSFFVNNYTAEKGQGEIGLVSAPVGDITALDVRKGKGYIIQKSAFIASSGDVDLDVKWEGFTKGLFGQGLFMIRTSGNGQLFINTFGAIDKHVLKADQRLTVDNFHLVAFSDSCDYEVKKFGGLKETILGGEGLVTDITGPGEVYIQTKNMREFVDWLWTILGPRVHAAAATSRAR
jgi:uncharacterized protein (TIGR00266 family)